MFIFSREFLDKIAKDTDPNLIILDLSNQVFTDDQLNQLLTALQSNKTIESLVIKNHFINTGSLQVLEELLKTNQTLKALKLDSCNLNAESIPILARGLNNSQILSLGLSDNQLADSGLQALESALAENTLLAYLDLSNNGISLKGENAIAGIIAGSKLLEINLSRNLFTKEGLQAIIRALATSSTLLALRLNTLKITLSIKETQALAQVIVHTSSLTTLEFCNNSFDLAAMEPLFSALQFNKTILTANFSGNKEFADKKIVPLIAALLKANSTLLTLDLSDIGFDDKGIAVIAQALHYSNVQELHLDGNAITDVGAHHLADALKHNKLMTVLTISRNHINNRGIQKIAAALEENPSLCYLDVTQNPFRQISSMLASIRKKPTLVDFKCDFPKSFSSPLEHNRTLAAELLTAGTNEQKSDVDRLLQMGVSPCSEYAFTVEGENLLMTAVRKNNISLASLLLASPYGANLKRIHNANSETAAHIAAALKRTELQTLFKEEQDEEENDKADLAALDYIESQLKEPGKTPIDYIQDVAIALANRERQLQSLLSACPSPSDLQNADWIKFQNQMTEIKCRQMMLEREVDGINAMMSDKGFSDDMALIKKIRNGESFYNTLLLNLNSLYNFHLTIASGRIAPISKRIASGAKILMDAAADAVPLGAGVILSTAGNIGIQLDKYEQQITSYQEGLENPDPLVVYQNHAKIAAILTIVLSEHFIHLSNEEPAGIKKVINVAKDMFIKFSPHHTPLECYVKEKIGHIIIAKKEVQDDAKRKQKNTVGSSDIDSISETADFVKEVCRRILCLATEQDVDLAINTSRITLIKASKVSTGVSKPTVRTRAYIRAMEAAYQQNLARLERVESLIKHHMNTQPPQAAESPSVPQ